MMNIRLCLCANSAGASKSCTAPDTFPAALIITALVFGLIREESVE